MLSKLLIRNNRITNAFLINLGLISTPFIAHIIAEMLTIIILKLSRNS